MSEINPYESTTENHAFTGGLTILTNIFTAPTEAMKQVQERYSFALPMISMALLMGAVMFAYYAIVDYAWFVDYLVESTAGELSKAEQDASRAVFDMMSQSTMGLVTAASLMIGIPIIYVIQAVYFVIVSNVNNDGYEFKQWLSFIAWTSMPGLIVVLTMAAVLLTSSNGQIPPDSLNALSLNELIFGLDPTKGLGKLLASIHIAQIWSFVLMVIGYQVWTKKSMATSAMIVMTPFVLFYLGWFLFFV